MVYWLLFYDSFRGSFVFSLSLETMWFSARLFEHYNLLLITALCYVASVLGSMLTYAVGRGFATVRGSIFSLDEEIYQDLAEKCRKYGVYIFLFQMLPFVKVLTLFAGGFSIPWRRMLYFTLAGRVIFYGYYIFL